MCYCHFQRCNFAPTLSILTFSLNVYEVPFLEQDFPLLYIGEHPHTGDFLKVTQSLLLLINWKDTGQSDT